MHIQRYLTIVKTVTSHIFFVEFILFLFSNYCWETDAILIYFIKHCEIISRTMVRRIFCAEIYCKTVFWDCSSKIQKEVLCQQISKQESDFQVGHELGSWWHLWRLSGNEFLTIWAFDHPGGICIRYQQPRTPHSPVPSSEWWTSGTSTLGLFLTFLIRVWD